MTPEESALIIVHGGYTQRLVELLLLNANGSHVCSQRF